MTQCVGDRLDITLGVLGRNRRVGGRVVDGGGLQVQRVSCGEYLTERVVGPFPAAGLVRAAAVVLRSGDVLLQEVAARVVAEGGGFSTSGSTDCCCGSGLGDRQRQAVGGTPGGFDFTLVSGREGCDGFGQVPCRRLRPMAGLRLAQFRDSSSGCRRSRPSCC